MLYEATLTDTFGTPSRSEHVVLTLSLVDVEGNTLYTETHSAVTDRLGRMYAMIGTGTSDGSPYSDTMWDAAGKLEVSILRADGSQMTDVTELGYTPVSLHADTAGGLVSASDGKGRYSLAVDDSGAPCTRPTSQ